MSDFSILTVSASAMEAQRKRMNTIASNLANVHTTRTEEGGPYRRKDVVFVPEPVGDDPAGKEVGVKVNRVFVDPAPPQMVHIPGHPDADENGFVAMPPINSIEEMVNMMTAVRSYEANVAVFNMSKALILKALDIVR